MSTIGNSSESLPLTLPSTASELLMVILEALDLPYTVAQGTLELARKRTFRTRLGPFGFTSLGRRALANCVGSLAFTLIAKSSYSAVLVSFPEAEKLPHRQYYVGRWDSVWDTDTSHIIRSSSLYSTTLITFSV